MSSELPEGWRRGCLGDLVRLRAGTAFSPALQGRATGTYPFIKVKDLGRPGNEDAIRVAENWVLAADLPRLKAKPHPAGSVVFAKIGEGMKSNRVRRLVRPTLIDNNMMAAVATDGTDPGFILHLIREMQLHQYAGGSAVPYLRQSDLLSLSVDIPSLEEQRRIAGVLGALDSKIEHTVASCARAEQVLAALYQELSREEWPTRPISESFEVIMGQSPKGETYSSTRGAGLPLVQGMGAFEERFPSTSVFTSTPTKQAVPGDVLMTVRAPVGAVNVVRELLCAGRGVAAIRSSHPAYCEQVVRALRDRWKAQESGTIFPAVNKKQIEAMPVPTPSAERIAEFERVARPLYELAGQLHDEASRLRATRDELLPRLISGRLRVEESFVPGAFATADEEQAA